MKREDGFHRRPHSFKRNVPVCLLRLRVARSKPSIDHSIRVHENNRERHVIVELEPGKIDPVHLDHAETDKLIHQPGDHCIATNNLFVERLTGVSWDTSKDNQERLARRRCALFRTGQIVVNPGIIRAKFFAIRNHLLITLSADSRKAFT
jgi:hypothetical protein